MTQKRFYFLLRKKNNLVSQQTYELGNWLIKTWKEYHGGKNLVMFFLLSISFNLTMFAQSYVPISNYHSGISIEVQGDEGTDYIFDRYYFDPLINDRGICYIKSDINIALTHNANNSRIIQSGYTLQDEIRGTNFGEIRIKMDRDWQYRYWAGDNTIIPPERVGVHTEPWYIRPNKPCYPLYQGPFSFDNLEYESGVPVLGSTGACPTGRLNLDKEDRKDFYFRGMLDKAGNEYHYLSYADDDDQDIEWSSLEFSCSDGKSMLFCVNPKTPVIWLKAATTGAEYYTTPAKVWWIPKIHEQTSYVTDGVDIQLKNIMNSNTVFYRIDGGNYQAYTGPISSNILPDGEHTLEFYYNSTDVQTRKIIKNPDHPSKNDVFEDGKGHGYILWKDDAEFTAWKERMQNGCFKDEYLWYKEDKITPLLSRQFEGGIRAPEEALAQDYLMLAVVPVIEGIQGNEAYFAAAKKFLLHNRKMHMENMGFETQYTQDPKPSTLYYRGYYDDMMLYNNAITYDLMAKYYRSDQHAGGITPIEDLRIRDMLAQVPHEDLMISGGLKLAMLDVMNTSVFLDRYSYGGMQAYMHQAAGFVTALAMPGYNTNYYGTSGFDGTQATHPWTPYPDYPKSWKNYFIDYNDYRNPEHAAQMHGFPNQYVMFNFWDGGEDIGFITAEGDWGGRPGYPQPSQCGHGIEIFYNVAKRKFNKYYHQIHLWVEKSLDGTLYSHKEDKYMAYPRLMMANEYFPDFAPTAMHANNEDGKYKTRTRPMYFFFHNPDWATSGSPTTSVSIYQDTTSIRVGESQKIIEIISPANASNIGVQWETSNSSIVTINNDGVIQALNTGNATVIVTTNEGGFSDSCVIVVLPELINVALNKPLEVLQGDEGKHKLVDNDFDSRWGAAMFPLWAEIDLGSDIDLEKIELHPYQSRDYQYLIEARTEDGDYSVIVDRSNNTEENSVLSDNVSATARYIKITVTGANSYTGGWVAINELVVMGVNNITIEPVSGIEISASTLNLNVGQTAQLTANILPKEATDSRVKWSTSSDSNVTIDENGLVTAISPGSTTITVTTFDGKFSDECIITIPEGPAVYKNLSLGKPVMVDSENSKTYNGGLAVDGDISTDASRWVSKDTEYPHWIEIDLGNICKISKLKFWTGYKSYRHPITDYQIQYWDGSKWIDILSVKENTNAEVQHNFEAISTQKVRLYATSGDDNIVRMYEIEAWGIETGQTSSVSGVNITPTDLILKKGQNATLTASVLPTNASNKNLTWATNNPAVVTVDERGNLVAVSAGTAVITASTVEGGYTNNCTVTVEAEGIFVTSVEITSKSIKLQENETFVLSAIVSPNDADDKSISWSSSDDAVASVDENGKVTANSPGKSTITVTTNDGGYSGSCEVEVSGNSNYINLALNKPVKADSEMSDIFSAEKAVDGDNIGDGSRWVTGDTIFPHWIEIDLEDKYDVDKVKFWTGYKSYRHPVKSYQIQYWDGSTWVDIVNIESNFSSEVVHSFDAISTDKIRFYATAGEDNFIRMFEIEVWGTSYRQPINVTGIEISASSISLNQGYREKLKATVLPGNADDSTVFWNSSKPEVAIVDANGLVTAISQGKTVITVSTKDGGFSESCQVNVSTEEEYQNLALLKPVEVDSALNISFAGEFAVDGDISTDSSRWVSGTNPLPHWIEIDLQQLCNVDKVNFWTGYKYYRNPIIDYELQYWNGSLWDNILSVTGNSSSEISHNFDAVVTDKIRLYAKAGEDSIVRLFEIEAWGTIIQEIVNVSEVKISHSSLNLVQGQTAELSATILPSDAIDQKVSWMSQDPKIASVDNNGKVVAKTKGTTVITVTTNDGGLEAMCTVEVNTPSSIKEVSVSNGTGNLLIYPNPVKYGQSSLFIKGIQCSENTVLKVLDITGKMLYCYKMPVLGQNKRDLELALSLQLEKGVYILTVTDNKITQQSRFIVK